MSTVAVSYVAQYAVELRIGLAPQRAARAEAPYGPWCSPLRLSWLPGVPTVIAFIVCVMVGVGSLTGVVSARCHRSVGAAADRP